MDNNMIQLQISSAGSFETTSVTDTEGRVLDGVKAISWEIDENDNPIVHLILSGVKIDLNHHPEVIDINALWNSGVKFAGSLEELEQLQLKLAQELDRKRQEGEGGDVVEAPTTTGYDARSHDVNPHTGKVEPVVSCLLPEERSRSRPG